MARHRNRLDIREHIEIGLIPVMGSNITWFLCAGRKLPDFGVGMD